jgi:RNA polymerase sigma-70 factor (ECF subfamily)
MENDHHKHEGCLALFQKLSQYIDKELDETTCQQIEAHINDCPPCQTCLTTLKRTVDICRNTSRRPVPKAFSRKLSALIQKMV